jgi:hypothetical protein
VLSYALSTSRKFLVYLEDTLFSRISDWQLGISNFFPFIPGGYPAICAEYHRKRNENYFSASAVHQNALRTRSYPKEHILANARAGLFQGECLTRMALPHSNL